MHYYLNEIFKHGWFLYFRSQKTEIKALANLSAYLRLCRKSSCSGCLQNLVTVIGLMFHCLASCQLVIIFILQRPPAFLCSWPSSSIFEASNGRQSPSQTQNFSSGFPFCLIYSSSLSTTSLCLFLSSHLSPTQAREHFLL